MTHHTSTTTAKTQRQQDVCVELCGERWHRDTKWLKVTMEISLILLIVFAETVVHLVCCTVYWKPHVQTD